jgi:hypothetical protein
MLAGEVPKCSLQERMQERAALDVRLERIDAGSDCDSDELDALEMRMLNNASKDHSPAPAARPPWPRTRAVSYRGNPTPLQRLGAPAQRKRKTFERGTQLSNESPGTRSD